MKGKITTGVFERMAQMTTDPFTYIMVTVEMGFKARSDKKDIVRAWNKYHEDKPLPIPK